MKQIAITIGEMKRLQELGVDCSKASMNWEYLPTIESMISEEELDDEYLVEAYLFVSDGDKNNFPAFNLQDILDLLPKEIKFNGIKYCFSLYFTNELWVIRYEDSCGFFYKSLCSNNILYVAYEMLVWCLENGYAHLIIK